MLRQHDIYVEFMKKVLAILCTGALLICGACKRETKDERFLHDLQLFTQKECPKFVDPNIRMDSICYDIGTRTRTEYYTVFNQLDKDSIYTNDALINPFREAIQKELKNSIQLKLYKDEGITFCYDYRSNTTGKKLLVLTFTKEDYGN